MTSKKQRPAYLAQYGSHRAARAAKAERNRERDLRKLIASHEATTGFALAFKAAI